MQKTVNNFYKKTVNAISKFEYTVNMMCKEQILLTQKQILSMQKNKFDYCEI